MARSTLETIGADGAVDMQALPGGADGAPVSAEAGKNGATGPVAVVIPEIKVQRLQIALVGDSALISHSWSEKAKGEMRDRQMKRATQAREAKDPEKEFEGSLYRTEDGLYAFPSIAFKDAAVTAVTSVSGMTKVAARQAFHVVGSLVIIRGSEPKMREDMVRVGQGTADIRYRGEYDPWFVRLEVDFNPHVFAPAQIVNLFNLAGFGVGVGEWRPEKNGQNGRFHVATQSEARELGIG